MHRRFGVEVAPSNDVAACIGTKEFVGFARAATCTCVRPSATPCSIPRSATRPTPWARRSRDFVRCRCAMTDGDSISSPSIPMDVARALVLWSNSPSNPTGHLDDLEAMRARGDAATTCWSRVTSATRSSRGAIDRARILEHGSTACSPLHSISKRSNLAGRTRRFLRGRRRIVVGYLRSVRQHAGFMVPAPIQAAVAVAYDDDEHVSDPARRYRSPSDVDVRGAAAPSASSAPMPEGSFYLWCSKEGMDGWATRRVARRGVGSHRQPR